jgi:tryptophanyl-tRNA synthetase
LIQFFASTQKTQEIRRKYLTWNYWYGHAKLELLAILLEYLKPFREKRKKLENDFSYIESILEKGNKKVNEIATKKYEELMKIIWLS